MKKFWHEVILLLMAFTTWRTVLAIVDYFALFFIPLRDEFLGPNGWTNFDGGLYLSIAQNGYYPLQQAFFPLYPLIIRFLITYLPVPIEIVGQLISSISFLGGLIIFYYLIKEINKRAAWAAVLFLLIFPASFFFAAAYTESLFFLLAVSVVYAARHEKWWLAGLLGMLASMTRVFGILLAIIVIPEYFKSSSQKKLSEVISLTLIPLGLLIYMVYLWKAFGDPLAFFHVQPAFGANRSGNDLILIPQVLWRYLKIFFTVPFWSLNYLIAAFELFSFLLGLWLVWQGSLLKIETPYLFYSLAVLLLPTLTGTLSSMPRYFLSAFPLFFVLGSLHNKKIKLGLAVLFCLGLVIATAGFLRGYFIA